MEVEAATRRTTGPSPRAPVVPACAPQMARPRARRPPACSLFAPVFGILMLPSTRDVPIATGAKLTAPIASWFMRSAPAPASGACSVPLDTKDMAQGTTFGRRALPRRTTMPDRQEGPRCHPDEVARCVAAARVDVAKFEADPRHLTILYSYKRGSFSKSTIELKASDQWTFRSVDIQ